MPPPAPPPPGTITGLPPEFSHAEYLRHNEDLRTMGETKARHHYETFGEAEGRRCSAVGGRAAFVALVPAGASILEIGPFCTPTFKRPRHSVRYMEMYTREELRKAARDIPGVNPDEVPDIDYVWRGQPYLELTKTQFDVVFSAHNLAHHPCLVTHLRQVGEILKPGGRFFLVVPDRRYCFDHYISDSTIADALDTAASPPGRHAVRSVVQHRMLLTHNDADAHWRGEHGPDPRHAAVSEALTERLLGAVMEASGTGGAVDVHSWQFTPAGLRQMVDLLGAINMIPFARERVYPTLRPKNEFYVVLRRHGAPAEG